jgi:hypothetical protein
MPRITDEETGETWEVEFGPAFRAIMDCVDLCGDVLDLMPEWNAMEREAIEQRMQLLVDTVERNLVQWEGK